MTLTLVANIDDETRFLGVVGTVPEDIEPGYGFRIGDELLVLQGFVMPYATTQIDRNRWYVRRAQDGSTAASHTAGDEIKGAADAFVAATSGTTPPSPFAGGSGASDLDAVLALSTGQDIADALTGANDPSAGNAVATMADVGGGASGILAFTITPEDVLAGEGINAARALADSGNSASLSYEAVASGLQGNLIAILSDVQPSVGSLTVSVDGTTITLHLETDGGSAILSTYHDVRAAIQAAPAASALVTVTEDGVNASTVPYEAGDIYLGEGATRLDLASLGSGSIIWDAAAFIPAAWDANAVIVPQAGTGHASLFYDGPPDATAEDDVNSEGLAVQTGSATFSTAHRLRLTEAGDLSVAVTCDAGAVPTEGEMLLVVDVRTPA